MPFTTPMKAFIILALALTSSATAQIPLGLTPVEIDFDDFRGTGFAPTPSPGQLDSDSYDILGLFDGPPVGTASLFGDVQDSGDFARGVSAGGVTTGGVYAFETSPGDYALGFQPTGSDFNQGVVNVLLENTTGGMISAISAQGNIKFYNDAPRSTGVGLGIIPDVVIDANGQETSRGTDDAVLIASDLFSPGEADATPSWNTVTFAGTAEGLAIAPGTFFYLRFFSSDNGGTGERDEVALDDLVLTAVSAVSTEEEIAGEAAVRSVFPNPASSSASARLAVVSPRAERVIVQVYDMVGRLVATPYDAPMAAAAETVVALPTALAPGMYVVRVTGESFTVNRRLTVVR